jgi:cytidyltransferase-like protein
MVEKNKKNTTVMVFGTFDGIHDGHRHFLKESKKFGDKLVVAVAKDTTVKILKGHLPEAPLPNRIIKLKQENLADEVIPGDQEIGKWQIIKKLKPDVVCLGYDQIELRDALIKENFSITIEIIEPFKNGELHSSLLKNS